LLRPESDGRKIHVQGREIFPPLVELNASYDYNEPKFLRRNYMKELLLIGAFVGIYLLLQIYVLPKMGIST
jgi:hypothetical protein